MCSAMSRICFDHRFNERKCVLQERANVFRRKANMFCKVECVSIVNKFHKAKEKNKIINIIFFSERTPTQRENSHREREERNSAHSSYGRRQGKTNKIFESKNKRKTQIKITAG